MSEEAPRWVRRPTDRRENLLALGAGLGAAIVVGGAVFYLARLLASREPLQRAPGRGAYVRGLGEER